MFTKITRQYTYALVSLILLLASLWPTAAPVHAESPEEDTAIYDGGKFHTEETGPKVKLREKIRLDLNVAELLTRKWKKTPSRVPTLEVSEPIFAGGGEFRQTWPLLSLGGLIPLDFTLIYGPDLQFKSPLNNGRTQFPPWAVIRAFTSNTIIRIVEGEDRTVTPHRAYINVFVSDDTLVFRDDGTGNFVAIGPEKYQIKRIGHDYYLMDPLRERVYIFRSRWVGWEWWEEGQVIQYIRRVGEVVHILDRNNNRLSYTYNADNLPIRIEDGLGRSLELTYISSADIEDRHLSAVSDGYGRTVVFNYQQLNCQAGQETVLASFTDPMGQTTTFEYYDPADTNCNLLQKINRPLSNSYIDQTWTQNPHGVDAVNSQKDAYGNETTLGFTEDVNENIITTVTHPDGSQRVFHHERERYPLDVADETGKQFTMDYNSDWQMTSITDRLGDIAQITYHPESSKVASYTDAEGNNTTYTYTAQDQTFSNTLTSFRLRSPRLHFGQPGQAFRAGRSNNQDVTFTFYNLTRVSYADGSQEDFSYDDHGNVLTYTNRISNTWTYTYNDRGQPLTITNPDGGVETYTYNADGTLATSTDSDVGVTTYQYDAYKRIRQIDYPDGTNHQFTYNSNDFVSQITDQRDVGYEFEYDANNNLTQVVRASGTPISQTLQYQYDAMDRLIKFIDPASNETRYAYTYWGGLDQITYPDDAQLSLTYDLRRWISGVVDEAGQTWQIGRDDESVYSSVTTPAGRHIGLGTDNLGYITQVTDPLSSTIAIERDPLERIVEITDRLGRETTIGWDGEGRVISITMPVIGTTTYTRNGLGLITRITDQRGNPWDFGYTPMGRLNLIQDPLGNEWHYTYDTMGRLLQIAYPDGVNETRTYDGNGNLTARQFSDGLTITYAYDELNRPTVSSSVPVTVTYDDRDNITNTQMDGANFGATYDDRSRLRTVTYDGWMTVSYTYDDLGLVTQVTDDLTASWVKFTYDDDRLLTRVERSNDVTTDIERDANGRITRIRHGDKGEMRFTLDAEDRITQIMENLPLDVASFLTQELRQYTYDEADQITSAGFIYDTRGRRTADPERTYTWDSADRLTGITHGSTEVAYEYTAQGEVARRTVDGVTTAYFYNYAVRDHPIMAEKRGGGYVRFYVYTPGGLLLYFVDVPSAEAYFYHFNHIGTTLFLTDGAGDVTDTYGYTPYGRLVKHLGSNDQPFIFVGQYGVRQEGETGLYHMRARYYDSLTGRFISRDPIWPELVEDPKAVNPYQYAAQNPLSFIDPSGLYIWVDTAGNQYSDPWGLPDGTVVGAVDETSGYIHWGFKIGESIYELREKWEAEWNLPVKFKPEPQDSPSQRASPAKGSERVERPPARIAWYQPGMLDEILEQYASESCIKGEYRRVLAPGKACTLLVDLQKMRLLLSPRFFFLLLTVCLWLSFRWVASRSRKESG